MSPLFQKASNPIKSKQASVSESWWIGKSRQVPPHPGGRPQKRRFETLQSLSQAPVVVYAKLLSHTLAKKLWLVAEHQSPSCASRLDPDQSQAATSAAAIVLTLIPYGTMARAASRRPAGADAILGWYRAGEHTTRRPRAPTRPLGPYMHKHIYNHICSGSVYTCIININNRDKVIQPLLCNSQ